MNFIEPYTHLKMLFNHSQRSRNKKLYDALFNPDPYYNMLRKDIDECCEIAIRYDLVIDTGAGLLRGGRNIYEDSLHIKRLGRWESIQMVERYIRSVRFEDSLRH